MQARYVRISLRSFVLCALFSCNPSLADELDNALAYTKNGEFSKGISILERLANDGNGDAQYNLGILYQLGQGVAQDLPKAATLFESFANKGVRGQCKQSIRDGAGSPPDRAARGRV
jgi:TPR repeat protein